MTFDEIELEGMTKFARKMSYLLLGWLVRGVEMFYPSCIREYSTTLTHLPCLDMLYTTDYATI